MLDWKAIGEKAEEVNGIRAYIINDEFPTEFSKRVTDVGIYNRRIIYLPVSGHMVSHNIKKQSALGYRSNHVSR
jgi:hypothetical protein